MSVLILLLLAGLLLAGGFLTAFIWAARSGQFDDTGTPALRILAEGDGRDSASAKEDGSAMRNDAVRHDAEGGSSS